MKIFTEKEIIKLHNKIACYYAKTDDAQFDKGVNETIKNVCQIILNFEVENGIDEFEYNKKLFQGIL